MESAKDSFDIILQVGAGTGLLYLIRWFWWRVNAWCEVNAMVSSFLISIAFLALRRPHFILRQGLVLPTHIALLITIAVTTATWVATAFLAKPTDPKTLLSFYRKVRPFGPGWKAVRAEAGISEEEAHGSHENIPLALVGWASGVATIWAALFTVGNVLYGRWNWAAGLFGVFLISAFILIRVINKLWENKKVVPETA
jgi:hypothetical protein